MLSTFGIIDRKNGIFNERGVGKTADCFWQGRWRVCCEILSSDAHKLAMTLCMLTFLHFGVYENMVSGAVYKINWNKDLLSGIYYLFTLYYCHKFWLKEIWKFRRRRICNYDLRVCETICKRISPHEIFQFPKPWKFFSKHFQKFPKMNYQNNSPQNVRIPLQGDHQKINSTKETFASPNIREINLLFIYLRSNFRKRGRACVNDPLMWIENTKLLANFISQKSHYYKGL